jgi:hypothetical protein
MFVSVMPGLTAGLLRGKDKLLSVTSRPRVGYEKA